MKKIMYGLMIAAISLTVASVPTTTAEAQSTKLISHSITAADTITFSQVPSKIKAFVYNLTKTSGTVAGKVYLEAGTISGDWTALDSLTLSDVTTLQKKQVTITATNYLNYRWRCTNTSSATCAIKAAYLRRSDE